MQTLKMNKVFSIIFSLAMTLLVVIGVVVNVNTVKAAELESSTLIYGVEEAQELKAGDNLFGKYLFVSKEDSANGGVTIELEIMGAENASITFNEGLSIYSIKIGAYTNVAKNELYYKEGQIGDVEGYFFDFTAPINIEMKDLSGAEEDYILTLNESNLTVSEVSVDSFRIVASETTDPLGEKVDGFLSGLGDWFKQAGDDVSVWFNENTGVAISGSSILVAAALIITLCALFKRK